MKKQNLILLVILSFALIFQSCNWDSDPDELSHALGWTESAEDTTKIQDDVTFGTTYGSGNLPSSVDLTEYFPPIGDQGQYGTCVAWAVGYNHKSFLEAKINNRTNYSDYSQIFSAKDLFWSISNAVKGADCNGANFADAYDVIQSRGVATMSVVPYENLGDCSTTPPSSWTNDANNHKISNYREIDMNVNTIKSYLADGRAVVFGAKLGEEFMEYTGGVLNYQSYGYTGQHAYHAMILAGYDDSKGANGAFKVVNSWGTSWGENGYCWVDENYFVTDNFGFCAFVATDTQTAPDDDGDNQVDNVTDGTDLMAWELNDVKYPGETDPRWRKAIYNVFNNGNTTLSASSDWCIVYLLYNAYDGDDYQVVLFDYYSDDYGNYGENAQLTDANITSQIPAQGYWYNYVDVASGQSVSQAVNDSIAPFEWGYYMPDVTGDYYLVIFADAFDTFTEVDESNNYTYFTDADGNPLHIVNGVIQNAPAKNFVLKTGVPTIGQDADMQSVVTSKNLNAYTTKEISTMLQRDMKNGNLQKKVYEYVLNSAKSKTSYLN